jgi:3-oxoacyl-[acyl-carrier protein] reductase
MKPHVIGRSDPISWAIAASLTSTVHDYHESIPPRCSAVVIVVGPDPALEPVHLATLSATDWQRSAEQPMYRVLGVLQHAYQAMRTQGGRIVLVLPTIGITGGPYVVPWATALEGIRSMAKSAARQWTAAGVIVNLIAAPLHAFAPKLGAAAGHVTAAALPDDEKIIESVVETTGFLLGPALTAVVGETVVVDGGALMLP